MGLVDDRRPVDRGAGRWLRPPEGPGQHHDLLPLQRRRLRHLQGDRPRGEVADPWREFRGDVRPLAHIRKELTPFAVVTPDGQWHQKGDMGWWGMARNEQPKDEWKAQVESLLAAHQRCVAVVVDCHI